MTSGPKIWESSSTMLESMFADYGAWFSHREARYICPHCDWNSRGSSRDKWFKNTKEIILRHDRFFKSSSAIVISKCPGGCGKLSWEHVDLGYLSTFAEDYNIDRERIDREIRERWERADKEWEESLCRNCAWIVEHQRSQLSMSHRLKCEYPEGSAMCGPQTECERYIKGKKVWPTQS